jgi:hypothetical protein
MPLVRVLLVLLMQVLLMMQRLVWSSVGCWR